MCVCLSCWISDMQTKGICSKTNVSCVLVVEGSDQWVDCFNTMCFPWGEDEPGCGWRLYPSAPHQPVKPLEEVLNTLPHALIQAHTNTHAKEKHFQFKCVNQVWHTFRVLCACTKNVCCVQEKKQMSIFGEVHLLCCFSRLCKKFGVKQGAHYYRQPQMKSKTNKQTHSLHQPSGWKRSLWSDHSGGPILFPSVEIPPK